MSATNPALHYLAGAFDAAGSATWIARANRAPVLRLALIHPSLGFLQRVRELAGCGSITGRPSGSREWRVEGERARQLADELAPYLRLALPRTPDDTPPTEPPAQPPTPRPARDATEVGRELGVTGQYLARRARALGVGTVSGDGRRAVWSFGDDDVAALRDWLAAHGRGTREVGA